MSVSLLCRFSIIFKYKLLGTICLLLKMKREKILQWRSVYTACSLALHTAQSFVNLKLLPRLLHLRQHSLHRQPCKVLYQIYTHLCSCTHLCLIAWFVKRVWTDQVVSDIVSWKKCCDHTHICITVSFIFFPCSASVGNTPRWWLCFSFQAMAPASSAAR